MEDLSSWILFLSYGSIFFPQRSTVLLVDSSTNLRDGSIPNLVYRLPSHPWVSLSAQQQPGGHPDGDGDVQYTPSILYLCHQLTFLPLSSPPAQVPLMCRMNVLLLGGHTKPSWDQVTICYTQYNKQMSFSPRGNFYPNLQLSVFSTRLSPFGFHQKQILRQ